MSMLINLASYTAALALFAAIVLVVLTAFWFGLILIQTIHHEYLRLQAQLQGQGVPSLAWADDIDLARRDMQMTLQHHHRQLEDTLRTQRQHENQLAVLSAQIDTIRQTAFLHAEAT